jgi:hypothetical protein
MGSFCQTSVTAFDNTGYRREGDLLDAVGYTSLSLSVLQGRAQPSASPRTNDRFFA